jgi:uncharacterized protein YbaR (Trm112 family)
MSLDPLLLDLLACPIDKQPLLYLPAAGNVGSGVGRGGSASGILYNPRLRRAYRVDGGIPVLLADQGQTVTNAEHASLLRRAATLPDAAATLREPLDDLVDEHFPAAGLDLDDAASA